MLSLRVLMEIKRSKNPPARAQVVYPQTVSDVPCNQQFSRTALAHGIVIV
jgi:hypothetical protein